MSGTLLSLERVRAPPPGDTLAGRGAMAKRNRRAAAGKDYGAGLLRRRCSASARQLPTNRL
jgi:hypothetical protein